MSKSPILRQVGIAAATLCVGFSAGASMAYPGVLIYQLKMKDSGFSLDLDTSSWMGSMHGLAGIFGAAAPIVMQWRGRKFTFAAACLAQILGWVIAFAANSITMILLSEFILGFTTSVLYIVSCDTLSEMITPAYRNIVGQSYCTMDSLGIAMVGVMTRLLHWRIIGIIMCLPASAALLISLTWLESPLWLAYKNNMDQCKTNFIKLRGNNEQSMKELQEVMAAYNARLSKNQIIKGDNVIKQVWRQVTTRDFIIPAIHVFLLLNHIHWSGVVVIMIYSIELISKATQNDSAAFVGAIVINFVFVISSTASNILVRYFNNKTVLMFGTCGSTVCLLCASIVIYLQSVGTLPKNSLLSLYFLVGFIIMCSAGQIPVETSMSAELMPVKHRGIGGALLVISASSLSASSLKISPYLFVYLELWGTFLIYTLNLTVCGLLIWKYIPETKGKTLQEIENFYTHGTFEINLLLNQELEPIRKQNL